MAISSKPADIRLEVGVDVDSSFEIFKKDIDELVKRVNAEPRKIKIQLDEKSFEKELDKVNSQIKTLRKNADSSNIGNGSIASINASAAKSISQFAEAKKAANDYYSALIAAQKQVRDLRLSSDGSAWESDNNPNEVANLNRLRNIWKMYSDDRVRAQMSTKEQVRLLQIETDLSNKLAISTERRVLAENGIGGSKYNQEIATFEQYEREREEAIERSNEKLFQAHVEASKRAKQLYKEEVAAFEQSEREREEVIERSNEKLFQAHVEASKRRRQQAESELTASWQSKGLTESNIKSLFGKAEKNKELFEDFDALKDRYKELIALQERWKKEGANPNDERVQAITRERKAIKELIEDRLLDVEAKKKSDANDRKRQALLKQVYTLLTRLEKEEANWTAARDGKSSGEYSKIQRYAEALRQLAVELTSADAPVKELDQRVRNLVTSAAESERVIRANGEAAQNWRDHISSLTNKFASWFSITRVIMAAVRAVRQLISSAKEIDAALTQLKIVTNATNAEMQEFANTAIDLSHNLGKSVVELTKSIETFSRLGYNLSDAAELAKYATIMSNVAGVSADEATTGMTSIIKGFNLEVSDAEHVADILVNVGQKYAVSAAEMMEAYEKSGAALHATNTTLEKSAGLIAAANASVQDASVIGTALKTVSARVRGKNFCASVHSNMYAQELHVA